MKLVHYTNRSLFILLFFLMGAWGLLFYFTIIDEVMDETDDTLENYREIVVGTWYNRLYLRSRWLFLLASAGVGLFAYVVGLFVVTLVFDGTDGLYAAFISKLKSWASLLVILLIGVCRDFANFYRYYRSPECRRQQAEDGGARNAR